MKQFIFDTRNDNAPATKQYLPSTDDCEIVAPDVEATSLSEFAHKSKTDDPSSSAPAPHDTAISELSTIDMVLYCPECGKQHIDEPSGASGWTNPPHRSHLCAFCGCRWRPADIATNGVREIKTKGLFDSWNSRPKELNTTGTRLMSQPAMHNYDTLCEVLIAHVKDLMRITDTLKNYCVFDTTIAQIKISLDRLAFAVSKPEPQRHAALREAMSAHVMDLMNTSDLLKEYGAFKTTIADIDKAVDELDAALQKCQPAQREKPLLIGAA